MSIKYWVRGQTMRGETRYHILRREEGGAYPPNTTVVGSFADEEEAKSAAYAACAEEQVRRGLPDEGLEYPDLDSPTPIWTVPEPD